ncbi:MAG TPA: hypothetical protein VFX48_02600 [Saprospiraceae bacterium]|nr:hypothetical protein [Saprospiraceae bacterium]
MKTINTLIQYSFGAIAGILLVGLVSCGSDLQGKAGRNHEVRTLNAAANTVKANKQSKANRSARQDSKRSLPDDHLEKREEETRDSLIVIIGEIPDSTVVENRDHTENGDVLEIDTTGYADILNEVLVVEIDTSDLPY